MSKEMTLEEEMNAMLQGKYTSDVMDDDAIAVYDEENSDGYVARDEDDDYDEVDEAEDKLSGSDEIDDEKAGTDENDSGETTSDGVDDAGTDAKADDVVANDAKTGDDAKADLEDTDGKEADGVDGETKDADVGSDTDTADTVDDKGKEDSQLDEVKDKDDGSKEDEPGGSDAEVDYKQKYEEAQKELEGANAFREQVTADFKANGKIVKGITDPSKIVKNLQMSTGMTKKLDGYKSLKPLIKPLEDRGLLQDTAKFDMLMKLADKDPEALKQYMVNNGIDPIDIDTDNVNYDDSSTVSSQEELMFADMVDTADEYGVSDKFSNTVLNEWDAESAATLFSGSEGVTMSRRLAEQMGNGVYDDVMAIANNLDITEVGFRSKSSIEKYEIASNVYNKSNKPEPQEVTPVAPVVDTEKLKADADAKAQADEDRITAIKAEAKRVAEDEAEAKYTAKVAAKAAEDERIANEARDRATQASQNRTTTTTVPNESEPQSQEDFQAHWKKLMSR